jgi:REP element-mobilizing transposase RayT
VVVGFVVMPEHFHLLITSPRRATPQENGDWYA